MKMLKRLKSLFAGSLPADPRIASIEEALSAGRLTACVEQANHLLQSGVHAPRAYLCQAQALGRLGQSTEALALLRAAGKRFPKDAGIVHAFGQMQVEARAYQDAEVSLRQACALAPDSLPYRNSLAHLLHIHLGRLDEAIDLYRESLRQEPDDPTTLSGLATALHARHDYVASVELADRLIATGRGGDEARMVFATSALMTERLDDALHAFASLPEHLSNIPEVKFSTALAHLLAGHWEKGFALLEARFQCEPDPAVADKVRMRKELFSVLDPVPEWEGEPGQGGHIVILPEQGLGDCIMTMRLLPTLLSSHGFGTVTFLSPTPLSALSRRMPSIKVIDNPDDLWATQGRFDRRCDIMSLLHWMRVRPDAIPGAVPYLDVPAAERERWRARLPDDGVPRVGVVWAGGATFRLDHIRSLELDQLAPVLNLPGLHYVSLQKDEDARHELRSRPWPLIDLMDHAHSMMETAALIQNLDLVIAVDTAVAHLAGALGTPVWLLNRHESEWRWLRGREDSPWYPSMRIFTQSAPRDWHGVVQRLADELAAGAWRTPRLALDNGQT